MKVQMLYHTPAYHKLVEAIARVCYQSYGKLSPTSHTMVRSIMNKGHLSIASSGNMVFEISAIRNNDELGHLFDSLLSLKQLNNFIRITTPQHSFNNGRTIKISMNLLTLSDILENHIFFPEISSELLDGIRSAVAEVPYLQWFIDPKTEVAPSENPYIPSPTLGNPVILSEDFNALLALGFTDYELSMHATITVDMITDRASGLQMWRHGDMTGGCELSQRYCDRSNAEIREMVGVDQYPLALMDYADEEGLSGDEAREHYDAVIRTIRNHGKETVDLYTDLISTLATLGVSKKRAKEIARSILPNAMTTRIIQCRPLRQWRHFFHLRDTNHAQPEIQEDTQAIKQAFTAAGIYLP